MIVHPAPPLNKYINDTKFSTQYCSASKVILMENGSGDCLWSIYHEYPVFSTTNNSGT
jgi:hypothetical protein